MPVYTDRALDTDKCLNCTYGHRVLHVCVGVLIHPGYGELRRLLSFVFRQHDDSATLFTGQNIAKLVHGPTA